MFLSAFWRARLHWRLTSGNKNYRVLMNNAGQILLDPVVPVPERELWLWQNPEAITAVQRGIGQAEEGDVYHLGSFVKYAKLEGDD